MLARAPGQILTALGLDDLLAEGLLLPDFYSGAVGLSARFREGFSVRRYSSWQSRAGIINAVRSAGVGMLQYHVKARTVVVLLRRDSVGISREQEER